MKLLGKLQCWWRGEHVWGEGFRMVEAIVDEPGTYRTYPRWRKVTDCLRCGHTKPYVEPESREELIGRMNLASAYPPVRIHETTPPDIAIPASIRKRSTSDKRVTVTKVAKVKRTVKAVKSTRKAKINAKGKK